MLTKCGRCGATIELVMGGPPHCGPDLRIEELYRSVERIAVKMPEQKIDTFPVQTRAPIRNGARINKTVGMAAYEVYCHCYGPQEAMITGNCRGGFGAGELIAFLYARSFPRAEWQQRVDEALAGMEQL